MGLRQQKTSEAWGRPRKFVVNRFRYSQTTGTQTLTWYGTWTQVVYGTHSVTTSATWRQVVTCTLRVRVSAWQTWTRSVYVCTCALHSVTGTLYVWTSSRRSGPRTVKGCCT